MDLISTTQARADVARAVQTFLDMANSHPGTPEGHSFTAEPSGSKYRIVQRYMGTGASVHAFVDATTGDLYKAASWKVAAKGVRYNLLTDMDKIRNRFTWSGGWLYTDTIKRDNAREASK